jgi:hypothetical protein
MEHVSASGEIRKSLARPSYRVQSGSSSPLDPGARAGRCYPPSWSVPKRSPHTPRHGLLTRHRHRHRRLHPDEPDRSPSPSETTTASRRRRSASAPGRERRRLWRLFFLHVHKFILFKFNKTPNSSVCTSKQDLELGSLFDFNMKFRAHPNS